MAQTRGTFPLPQTAPALQGVPNVVMLQSGQTWYPPAGEYLISTGGQTVIQVWEQDGAIWRNYAPPGSLAQISCDGWNYRLLNNSGTCVGASITAAGSAMTNGIGPVQTGVAVVFAAPAAGGAPATAQGYVIIGGQVLAAAGTLTVAQGGSGFTTAPLVVCDPPPLGGIQATFVSTITAAGVLSTVTCVNPGAGYTSVPNFYIIPQAQFYTGAPRYPGDPLTAAPVNPNPWPPGLINPVHLWAGSPYQANLATGTLGALITPPAALTGSGTLTGIVMTAFGNGYLGSSQATVSFTGSSGSPTATPIHSFSMIAAIGGTVTASGGAAQIANTPAITSLGLIANPNDNNTFFPRPARGLNSGATGSFTLEDPGYGLQGGVVYVSAGTSTTVATVTSTQYGGRNDVSVVQAASQ